MKLFIFIFMSWALLAGDLPEQKDARPPVNPILSSIPILGWKHPQGRIVHEVKNVALFGPDGRTLWVRDIKVVPRMVQPREENEELESVE